MNYREAVDWLTPICEGLVSNGELKLPQVSADYVMLRLSFGLHPENGAFEVSDQVSEKLFQLAETNPGAFDLLSEICAANLMARAEITGPLRLFASERLMNQRTRPKGERRDKSWMENQYLLALVIAASSHFSLSPTRNEASCATSASDAVQQSFAAAGFAHVTYERLRKLFSSKRYSKLREELKVWANIAAEIPKADLIAKYGFSATYLGPPK